MEHLTDTSSRLVAEAPDKFHRYLFHHLKQGKRVVGIKGARGTGKTTLLLQKLKALAQPASKAMYVSLDDLYFTENRLFDLGSDFYKRGGRWLFLDEVHKYPGWAKDLKKLYDYYSDLQVLFTASSIIEISKEEADLSRRIRMYELPGMSYREYLNFRHGFDFQPISLGEIMEGTFDNTLVAQFKPLEYFIDYMRTGYYPFYEEDVGDYYNTLRQMVRFIVEYDMAELRGFDVRNARKMEQLLYVVAQSVPFKPNISKLADRIKIHRTSLGNYLIFLEKARLLNQVFPAGKGIPTMQKAEKLYLENTNLAYALSDERPQIGNIRETFFQNQLSTTHKIRIPQTGDFEVDGKYVFEIGGKNKSRRQVKDLSNAHVVRDDVEFPSPATLPLWIFGFLY